MIDGVVESLYIIADFMSNINCEERGADFHLSRLTSLSQYLALYLLTFVRLNYC